MTQPLSYQEIVIPIFRASSGERNLRKWRQTGSRFFVHQDDMLKSADKQAAFSASQTQAGKKAPQRLEPAATAWQRQ